MRILSGIQLTKYFIEFFLEETNEFDEMLCKLEFIKDPPSFEQYPTLP